MAQSQIHGDLCCGWKQPNKGLKGEQFQPYGFATDPAKSLWTESLPLRTFRHIPRSIPISTFMIFHDFIFPRIRPVEQDI